MPEPLDESTHKARYAVEEQTDGTYSIVDALKKKRVFNGSKHEAWQRLQLIRRAKKGRHLSNKM